MRKKYNELEKFIRIVIRINRKTLNVFLFVELAVVL